MSEENGHQLPPGWSWVRLDQIADLTGGLTKGQKRRNGETTRPVPYLRVANVQRGYLDLTEMKEIEATEDEIDDLCLLPGDILFNEGGDRDKLGRGWVWEGQIDECIHQNHVFRARLRGAAFNPRFISYWGNSFGQQWFLRAGKQSVNLASINLRVLKSFPVPAAPRHEQDRIVEKLEELLTDVDAAAALLARVRRNLNRYRASVLKAAVTGTLTAEWRDDNPGVEPAGELLKRILAERRRRWEEDQLAKFNAAEKEPPKGWKDRYADPEPPDTNNLPELPQGWCWATIDQLADVQGGLQKSPARKPVQHHYPYLRVANVLRGRLDLGEIHRFELSPDELERLRLEKGDLLIVEGNGSITEIGRSALWMGEIADCVHQNHIIRVRFGKGVLPEYADAVINSPFGQSCIQRVASSTSGLHTLSVAKVRRIVVPLPPTAEQEIITEELARRRSVLEALSADIDDQQSRVVKLRQSILRRAFAGRLVLQDPNDQPVSLPMGGEPLRTHTSPGKSKRGRRKVVPLDEQPALWATTEK